MDLLMVTAQMRASMSSPCRERDTVPFGIVVPCGPKQLPSRWSAQVRPLHHVLMSGDGIDSGGGRQNARWPMPSGRNRLRLFTSLVENDRQDRRHT
jgi:hypothetical protein